MEERHVTIQDAAQFVRELLELGGVYKIDSTDFIVSAIDGSVITVEVDGKNKPIMLWSEKAKLGDHVLLNIFGETINTTVERNWFYTFIGMLPGHIIKNMMMSIINSALSTTESNTYAMMEAITPFVKEIDEKTKTEFSLLTVRDIALIVFHKPSKTAQLQTKLFDEEFRKSLGKKIRVKTWTLFENMFKALMNVETVEQMHETFKYTATILGMKQTDAMVHVLLKFAENVDAFQKVFSGKEFNLSSLISNQQNLEIFFGIMRVFTSGGGQRLEAKPAQSPFGNSVPVGDPRAAAPNAGQSFRPVTIGMGIPVTLPNVLDKVKARLVGNNQQQLPLPDVLHGGIITSTQQQPQTAYQPLYAANSRPSFGKVVVLDSNPQPARGQGPKVRQILDNGQIV